MEPAATHFPTTTVSPVALRPNTPYSTCPSRLRMGWTALFDPGRLYANRKRIEKG